MIGYLTLEDLLRISRGFPVRDIGLLEAAARRPSTTLYGTDAYPDIHTKAAVLLESITRNHALLDGNKRLGWLSVHVFYALNGFDLNAPDDPAYDLVIAVATGTMDHETAAASLSQWVREI